jgi:hypothetical protein
MPAIQNRRRKEDLMALSTHEPHTPPQPQHATPGISPGAHPAAVPAPLAAPADPDPRLFKVWGAGDPTAALAAEDAARAYNVATAQAIEDERAQPPQFDAFGAPLPPAQRQPPQHMHPAPHIPPAPTHPAPTHR